MITPSKEVWSRRPRRGPTRRPFRWDSRQPPCLPRVAVFPSTGRSSDNHLPALGVA